MTSKQDNKSPGEKYKDKGNDEFNKGNYEAAIENYTYATECDPKNSVFYNNRANCYHKMGKYDKSLRDATKAVELNPAYEKAWFRKAVAETELKQYPDAAESYTHLLSMKPDEKPYKDGLKEAQKHIPKAENAKLTGNAAFKKGKIDEALKAYTEGISSLGDDDQLSDEQKSLKADLFANRGACYIQLYEPTKVRADCTAALALVPGHSKALLRRAQALEALEKYKDALTDFESVLKVYPENDLAIKGISRIRNAIRRNEVAEKKERG
jgi:tetratricopeptide (TPR) repeat protein